METLILIEPDFREASGTLIRELYTGGYEKTHYGQLLNCLQDGNYIGSELQLLIIAPPHQIHARAANILGKFAEAIIVEACNNSPEINQYIANSARFAKRLTNTYVGRFTAIGTGLNTTRDHPIYYIHHQPHDKQADVIWVDKRNARSLLMCPNTAGFGGIPAGLQLKVSFDWRNIGYSAKFPNYDKPILYFDMKNDWNSLSDYIESKKRAYSANPSNQWHTVSLIKPNEITEEIKQQLWWFYDYLIKLIEGKIKPQYIIDKAKAEGDAALGASITAGQRIIVSSSAIEEGDRLLRNEQMNNSPNQSLSDLVGKISSGF